MSNDQPGAGLVKKLKGVLLRQRLIWFIGGVIVTTVVTIASGLFLSLIAYLVILPVWLKISLMVVSALATVYVFGRYAIGKALAGSVTVIAMRLEQYYPDLKGRLVAAVEFYSMSNQRGYSPDLIGLTVRQAEHEASGISFNRALTMHPLVRKSSALAVFLFIATSLAVLAPAFFDYSYLVYSNPTQEIRPPLGYRLEASPGSLQWVKYRDIEIGALIIGDQIPNQAIVHHRLTGGTWQETRIDLRGNASGILLTEDTVRAAIKLRQVARSFDYYVEAGRLQTEIQKVDVVDRPRVTGIKLSLFYPEYTGLEPTLIDENNGSFSAIVGTRVNMTVTSNLPVDQAFIVYEDSSRQTLEIAGDRIEGSLRVDKSRAYYLHLVDALGEVNPDPIEFYITAIPDEYPSIDIIRPGYDVNLSERMILPLKARIYDDYGFSSLVLKYSLVLGGRASEENVAILHYSDRIKTEGEVEFNWDLDQYHLYPGDYVIYQLEIADNDRISGPKVSASRKYIARLPSIEEIVANIESESAERVSRTEKMLRSGKEVAERAKQITRKLKAQARDNRNTDWQHQKELKEIAEQNEELLNQIEQAAKKMDQAIDNAAENSMMSRQILEKMSQVRKLFEEIATPEMRQAQQQLMEALKKMNRDQLEKSMDDYQLSMEEMLQRLERTLALLKKLQVEQKMEAMLRQLEQLVKQQESVNKQTDSIPKSGLPHLSPEENEIRSSLQKLKEQTSELDELAAEADLSESPDLKKFAEELKNSDADQNMQQMSQALQSQERSEASDQGKKALSKMLQMMDQMQQSLASMQGNDAAETERAMRMAIDDAQNLSQTQENLHQDTRDLSSNSMVMHDQATSQQDLQRSCSGLKNRINELGKQSPFVASELNHLVDNAVRQMDMATESLAERRKAQSMQHQREAMFGLNRAALRLMESLQQQKQCNNGSSCDKPSQKLQSMCNKQNKLNQMTQKQCNNPGQSNPQFKPEGQRPALDQLAGEQAVLRKSLEELNREFGDSRQILGRLDAIANEMRQVEEDLLSGNAGEQTMERQMKIYSRLLEASRSLQRRDFTQQRQARSADEHLIAPPQALPAGMFDGDLKLEDRLRQYLSEEYPQQYEEQIKAYFRALLKSNVESSRDNPASEATTP